VGTILVTGGAGFIGSHLVERLLARGSRVVALDNFDAFYPAEVKRRNLAGASGHADFRLVEGDIRDASALDLALAGEGVGAVVHLAARAGVRPSIAEPALYASVNLEGTVAVLEACRRHAVPTLLFGSSSSVYGNNAKVPFAEDDPVDRPISPYAATKRGGELLAHTYHHLFGLRVACLRFFTVFGPRQRPDLAIHAFARLLAEGRPLPIFGDGSSGRDYTYVDDVVDGVLRALERTTSFHVWNLGGSHPVLLRELVDRLASGLGVPARLEHRPMPPGDVDRTWADVSRARAELGWTPSVGFDEGIERFLSWFRSERGRPAPARAS
jgi:UDP-glucuronate 4-epimerase